MTVYGAHLPDGEVAQRYRRKALHPGADGHRAADDALELVARESVDDYLDAVHVIPGAEQHVEQKQLPGDVGDVQHLGGGVQRHQVIAVAVADAETEQSSGQKATYRSATAGTVSLLILEIVVQMSYHVLDRLLSSLRVQRVLDRLGRLDKVVDIDAGTVIQ